MEPREDSKPVKRLDSRKKLSEIHHESQEESGIDFIEDELPETKVTEADVIKAQQSFFGKDFDPEKSMVVQDPPEDYLQYEPLHCQPEMIDDQEWKNHKKRREELENKFSMLTWSHGCSNFDSDPDLQDQIIASIATMSQVS